MGHTRKTLKPERKIFGIGLGRTGTSSLADALNLLGIKTQHFPHDRVTQQELISGSPITILQSYQGIVDGIAPFYRQLDKIYPNSRFILTIRNQADWLKSTHHHAEVRNQHTVSNSEFSSFSQRLRQLTYGTPALDNMQLLQGYERHFKAVLDYFQSRLDDLLVMNICSNDDWDLLCPFLGLPIPNCPFPHRNNSQTLLDWSQKVSSTKSHLDTLIDKNDRCILVDDCQLELKNPQILPFLEHGGSYWGLPPDDSTAISELERMRQDNVSFIAFAWTAFWWFDYYKQFYKYLRTAFHCIFENSNLIVFDLRRDKYHLSWRNNKPSNYSTRT